MSTRCPGAARRMLSMGHQALAAREHLAVTADLGEDRDGLGDALPGGDR